MIKRIFSIPTFLVLAFLLTTLTSNHEAHAKPKRQYPTCAYKTDNLIRKPKIKKFDDLKKCTLRNAARKNVKIINWFYKDMFAEMQRKEINKALKKMMKKHPKKRKQLRARLLAKLSLHVTLKSFKGRIINRSRKNCRIKFTKIMVRMKSCQTSKGL